MVTVSQKMKDDYEEFLVEIDLLLEDLQHCSARAAIIRMSQLVMILTR